MSVSRIRQSPASGILLLAALLVLWQVSATQWIDSPNLPALTSIATSLVSGFQSGELPKVFSESLFIMAVGYTIGVTCAVTVGLLMANVRPVNAVLDPMVELLRPIPIPAIVFNQVAFPLQLLASRFGESALQLADIPVLREGNVITLAHTQLEVAEACSGIRSLISLLTLGIVIGYFAHSSVIVRWLLAIATVPVAIAANGLRVAGTGIAAHYYGPEAAQGFFHSFSGWLVFLVALAMLLAVHRAIDVTAIGCDALVTSAYKWYGPHAAAMFVEPGLLGSMRPYKLTASGDEGPSRLETGMPNYEALAGLTDAARYLRIRRCGRSLSKANERMDAAFYTPVFPRFYSYDVLRGLRFLARWSKRTGAIIGDEEIAEVRAALEHAFGSGGDATTRPPDSARAPATSSAASRRRATRASHSSSAPISTRSPWTGRSSPCSTKAA